MEEFNSTAEPGRVPVPLSQSICGLSTLAQIATTSTLSGKSTPPRTDRQRHFKSPEGLLHNNDTGPYVVDFDGKEAAVINALNTTLMPLDPIKIQITSYTVGAPVHILTFDHHTLRTLRPVFGLGPSAFLLPTQVIIVLCNVCHIESCRKK